MGNRQALPLLIYEMGLSPNINASTDKHEKRQLLLLLRRKGTD
jgi:hypothetical protein